MENNSYFIIICNSGWALTSLPFLFIFGIIGAAIAGSVLLIILIAKAKMRD